MKRASSYIIFGVACGVFATIAHHDATAVLQELSQSAYADRDTYDVLAQGLVRRRMISLLAGVLGVVFLGLGIWEMTRRMGRAATRQDTLMRLRSRTLTPDP